MLILKKDLTTMKYVEECEEEEEINLFASLPVWYDPSA